jgi:predicted lactoylglutathione lyase
MVKDNLLVGVTATSTAADVLAALQAQGITTLDQFVQKAIDVGREVSDADDEPVHREAFIHEHFFFYHDNEA